MNPTPESPPPPPPPPESEPPLLPSPVTATDKNAWWRKFLWVVLATVVTAPLVWWAGVFIVFACNHEYEYVGINLLIVTVVEVAVTVYLVRLGLKRGWHNRTGLSIVAAVALLVVVLGVRGVQKVRRSSQDKDVLGHARWLSEAADQYFLNNGASTVDYAHLVGQTNYVKVVWTVANETYPVYYTQGVTITITGIAGARTVTYSP